MTDQNATTILTGLHQLSTAIQGASVNASDLCNSLVNWSSAILSMMEDIEETISFLSTPPETTLEDFLTGGHYDSKETRL